jgi:hypothetical protein
MSGSLPSASLFDLAGLPSASALMVPLSLAAATLLRSGDDLSLIDHDGRTFTLYGYFTHEPQPVQGLHGDVLTAAEILAKTASLSAATFRPFRPFAPETLETLLSVAFGEHAALRWQERTDATENCTLALRKTAEAGVVTCNGVVLRRGDVITLADLRQGRVRYYHDETETREDLLEFASLEEADPLVLKVRLNIEQLAA